MIKQKEICENLIERFSKDDKKGEEICFIANSTKNLFESMKITKTLPNKFLENLLLHFLENWKIGTPNSRRTKSIINNIIVEYVESHKKQDWPELQPYLLMDYKLAISYTRIIIKQKWPQLEKKLSENYSTRLIYSYFNATKQKLSEDLHNAMIAKAIQGNSYAIKYIKNLEKINGG